MVTAAQAEKHLLWHPRWQNKFVVGGGSQMSMYEWAADRSEIRHLSSQSDLSFMKCFAWSPDPAFDDLFAIGLASGRVDLLRLEATKIARNGVLSSEPVVSLTVRNSRSCNALAFCQVDPNYLAVGLDKVRGDPSLIIWDVQSSIPTLSLSRTGPSDEASVARPQPRIARADIGPRTDTRVLQHHAPTEVVSALSFLPQSTHLLLAGISARWLRLFDLRSPTPPTTNVASKVSGIATNPADPHQVACCGDGTVTVWDVRRLSNPLLTFTEKDAAADGARPRPGSVAHRIEFSSTRRGQLAAMEKDSTYVRFWDLQQAQAADGSSDGERSRDSSQSRVARMSWTNLPWATSAYGARQNSTDPQEPSALVLADTRKTKYFSRPLASFALVPHSRTFSLTSEVMVVNKDGDLELYALHDTPKQVSWSSRGDLVIGAGLSYKLLPGFQDRGPLPQPWDIPSNSADDEFALRERAKADSTFRRGDEDEFPALSASGSSGGTKQPKSRTYSPASFRKYTLELSTIRGGASVLAELPVEQPPQRPATSEDTKIKAPRAQIEKSSSRNKKHSSRAAHQVIEDDISMMMRHRAIQGYGIGRAAHNVDVTQGDLSSSGALSGLWAWIRHSRELMCIPIPRIHGYDFSNQGLLGIWEGFPTLPQSSETRPSTSLLSDMVAASSAALDSSPSSTLGSTSFFSQSSDDLSYGDFNAAITALLPRQGTEKSWSPALRTNKLAQRELALQLCGWYLKDEDLSNAIKKWEKDGQQSRAACWLVFTRQYTRALELLMRSKDEMHHLMTGTLAALIPGSSTSNELRDHSERLIVRLQDPYFRAMLTQLTSKDWSEVLEEEALPLRERLAIAFQFLEDRALSLYLHRTAERASTRGDIEGLVITGLTPAGMDILQNYVDRTGDIQSAAILSSYVCPAKFSDMRAERWLEAYRNLLDGFRLFHHRVSFDIDRGQILQEAVQNGDLPPFEWAPRHILIRCNYCSKPVNPSVADVINKSRPTACPNCSRALPRCSVCLMTLSIVPDANRDAELLNTQVAYKDTIEDAIIICQTCRHGGHASHILDWFFGEEGSRSHGLCPVADCDCRCGDEF
ncbi:WD40 repeat-like protein [Gyrodon lividus]|nr:WD40 repeat-like protein [Gyrodon lividus]